MQMPDKETIKDFFIHHTEKICFGVFVLCFLIMIWGGLSLPRMEIQPDQLKQSVEQAQNRLRNSKPDPHMLPTFDYHQEADLSAESIPPVALSLLEMPQTFRHAIAQPQVKRMQPPVLVISQLQVSSGSGFSPNVRSEAAPAMGNPGRPGSNSNTAAKITPGVRWVVVTGLIPIADQERCFFDTFKSADVKYPDTDRPSYYGYQVQRAEIIDGKAAKEADWKPLDLRFALYANSKYAATGVADVVAPQFILPSSEIIPSEKYFPAPMAMNLMSLTKHQWGSDCAHLPEIPSVAAVGGNNGGPTSDDPGAGYMEEDFYNNQYAGGGQPGMGINGNTGKAEKPPKFKLFRFFDTNVEGNKQYQYRFKLVLKNPNFNVKADYVEKESLTVEPVIEGGWSEPSPIALVPRDTRILCVGNREASDTFGPFGKLMILKFDEVIGSEITKTLGIKENKTGGEKGTSKTSALPDVLPGSVLNYTNISYDGSSLQDAYSGTTSTQKSKSDFITDNVMLDFVGGDRPTGLPQKSPLAPARALMMDQDGKIYLSEEIKDKPSVFQKSQSTVPQYDSSYGAATIIQDENPKKPGARPKRPTTPSRPRQQANPGGDGDLGGLL